MKKFGYWFTSNTGTVFLLMAMLVTEGGPGIVTGFAKEWADQVRLWNGVVSLVFLILLHNRSYRQAQNNVEKDESA